MNPAVLSPRTAAGRASVAADGARPAFRDVDLWSVDLDAAPPARVADYRGLLAADEMQRANSFYFERDRRRFVLGRGILRALLGGYLGIAAADVRFSYGVNGKPALAAPDAALWFNVAHSERLAVFAFSCTGELGVDVERVRELPDWEHIAATFFSAREQAQLQAASADRRHVEFFRAWTRREAMLKAIGIGLGSEDGRLGGAGATVSGRGFALYRLPAEPGFAAALAVSSACRHLNRFRWDHAQGVEQQAWARRTDRVRLEDLAETLGNL